MKFQIQRCLISFRDFLKSVSCCNSKCCSQTIDMMDDENIQKLQELQDHLENMISGIKTLRRSISKSNVRVTSI